MPEVPSQWVIGWMNNQMIVDDDNELPYRIYRFPAKRVLDKCLTVQSLSMQVLEEQFQHLCSIRNLTTKVKPTSNQRLCDR